MLLRAAAASCSAAALLAAERLSGEDRLSSGSAGTSWWEEWWALALMAVGLVGIMAAAVAFRTRKLASEKRRLEKALAARSAELVEANRELGETSVTDLLTGLRNRRYFSASIAADVAKAERACDGRPGEPPPRNPDLVFHLVDLDRFKEINDIFGHDAGDAALVEVARRLTGAVRRSDSLIRWGGEEFLIVSRETDRSEAPALAERVLSAVSTEPFDLGDGRYLLRTCSVGWAPFPWVRGAPRAISYQDVLRLADRALTLAKTAGKHRAVGILPRDVETSFEGAVAAAKKPVLEGEGQNVRLVCSDGPPQSVR